MHVDEARWAVLAPWAAPGWLTSRAVAVPAASSTAAAPATSAWRLVQAKRAPEESRSDIQITPAVLAAPAVPA